MAKKRSPKRAPASPLEPAQSWTTRWPATLLLLFCATAIAYWPALSGAQLWDDDQHITQAALRPLHGLWRIWSDLSSTQQYYPLLYTAFWVEHRIWGDATTGYHLMNIALHSVSALLVFLIARRLKLPGAWLAALFFALHPVCVESVAWITEQKNTLSGVFYLASMLTYLKYDETRTKSTYCASLVLFILALLSKSATVILPGVLLVLLWWRRGRLDWRRDAAPLAPWFALALSSGLLTSHVERVYLGAHGSAFELSPLGRVLLATRVPWFYASKVLWPVDLVFSYPKWKIDPGAWWQYLFPASLAILTAALVFRARRNRGPLAALLIFCGSLFPVLGFLNVFYFRYSYVADHFQYLACLAILVPAAAGLSALAERFAIRRPWRIGLSAALLLCLAGLTWTQSTIYTDRETLYRSILARNPESWLAHNNLGLLLVQTPGGLAEATVHYREAVRIEPDYPEAHFNLASARAHSGSEARRAEAEAGYRTALRLKPDYVEAHYNLANLLAAAPGRLGEAVAEYRTALRIEPDLAEAHANLGNALARIPGQMPDAIGEYQSALRLKPALTMQRLNLANALAETGRLSEAIAQCEMALRIAPDLEPARELLERLRAAPR